MISCAGRSSIDSKSVHTNDLQISLTFLVQQNNNYKLSTAVKHICELCANIGYENVYCVPYFPNLSIRVLITHTVYRLRSLTNWLSHPYTELIRRVT